MLIAGQLRRRSCLLESDKIFATFGIANLIRPRSVPESIFSEAIGLDTEQVFKWMTSYFLQHMTRLDALSLLGPSPSQSQMGIPSWVINFSEETKGFPLGQLQGFDAALVKSKGTCGHVQISGDTLIAGGLRICSIKRTFGKLTTIDLVESLLAQLTMKESNEYIHTGQQFAEAVYRSLFLNSLDEFSPGTPDFRPILRDWMESILVLKYLFPQLRSTLQTCDGVDLALSGQTWLILVVGVLAGNGVLDLDFPKIMRTAESIKKHAQWQAVAQKFSILAGHAHMFSIIYDAIPGIA